jgi:hypothetical protein
MEHKDIDDKKIQSDSNFLSRFPWATNGNPDNNLELFCAIKWIVIMYYERFWAGFIWLRIRTSVSLL